MRLKLIIIIFCILSIIKINAQNTPAWLLKSYNEETVTEAFQNTEINLWIDAVWNSTICTVPNEHIHDKLNDYNFFIDEWGESFSYAQDSLIYFNGNNYMIPSSYYSSHFADSIFQFGTSDFAIFLVFKPTSNPSNNDEVIYKTTNNNNYFRINTNGSFQISSNARINIPSANALARNQTYILTIQRTYGQNIKVYINGNLVLTNTSTSSVNYNFTKTTGNQCYFACYSSFGFGELISARGTISDIYRQTIESYLKKKWGF